MLMRSFIYKLNNVGERQPPCLKSIVVQCYNIPDKLELRLR